MFQRTVLKNLKGLTSQISPYYKILSPSYHKIKSHPFFSEALSALGVLWSATGIHMIEQHERGLVEIFGKYIKTADPGLVLTWPIGIGNLRRVPMDLQRVLISGQSIITKEQLNATVEAVVYYRVNDPFKAQYNIDNFASTVPTLAQTTLRNVLGTLNLSDANSQRRDINERLKIELENQIKDWGMEVINVELQQIKPSDRVQESMNNIIIAEQEKIAAENLANAEEIKADGERRATIKKAQANADAIRLEAEANADAMKIEYEAAQEFFKDGAIPYQQLKTTETALKNNTTVLFPKEGNTWNLLDIARLGKN